MLKGFSVFFFRAPFVKQILRSEVTFTVGLQQEYKQLGKEQKRGKQKRDGAAWITSIARPKKSTKNVNRMPDVQRSLITEWLIKSVKISHDIRDLNQPEVGKVQILKSVINKPEKSINYKSK